MPTRAQKVAVALAFVAAALSLSAAALRFSRDGSIAWVPVLGGCLMLVFGIAGYSKLKRAPAARARSAFAKAAAGQARGHRRSERQP